MDVRFRNSVLQRCYEEQKKGVKRWNKKVARLYVRRVNLLFVCTSAQDLSTLPQLRFHPLKGDMKGRYAIDIDESWRLIVSFDKTMQIVYIEEVSKHYEN